ncbi:hypothetical protein ACPA9J_28425 [Pseudomonas aeruginosa]
MIQSVAVYPQFITYYQSGRSGSRHDRPTAREESPVSRDSMAQILDQLRACATGHCPISPGHTGIVTVFVRVGMDVRWVGATGERRRYDQRRRAPRAPTCRRTSARLDPWPTRPAREEHQG